MELYKVTRTWFVEAKNINDALLKSKDLNDSLACVKQVSSIKKRDEEEF